MNTQTKSDDVVFSMKEEAFAFSRENQFRVARAYNEIREKYNVAVAKQQPRLMERYTGTLQFLLAELEAHQVAFTYLFGDESEPQKVTGIKLTPTQEELDEARTWRQKCALLEAEQNVVNTKKLLERYIRSTIDTLTRDLRDLNEENGYFNSLGILQGNGVEIDRLCGVLDAQKKGLALLKQALR